MNACDMHEQTPIDLAALVREIARYLAAVEAFRSAGHEPTWSPECAGSAKSSAAA